MCPSGSPLLGERPAAAATATPSGSSSSPAPWWSWALPPGALAPFWGLRGRAQNQARAVLVPAGVRLLVGTAGRRYICIFISVSNTLSPGLSVTHLEARFRARSASLFCPLLRPSLRALGSPLPDGCLCPPPPDASYPARTLTPPIGLLCPAPRPHGNPPYSVWPAGLSLMVSGSFRKGSGRATVTVPVVTSAENHCDCGVGGGLGPGSTALRQAGRSSRGRGSAARTEPGSRCALRPHGPPARRQGGGPGQTAAVRSPVARAGPCTGCRSACFYSCARCGRGPVDTAMRAALGSHPPPREPALRELWFAAAKGCRVKGRSSRSLWALSSGAAPSPSPPPAGSCAPAPGAARTAGKRPVLPVARRQRPACQRLPAPPDQGGADGEAGGRGVPRSSEAVRGADGGGGR